ncbi:transglycosylase domain-containing protein [Saccharomonospora cyanea]|uniref:Membrane carboxypeptidase (Penicillin-binding protein) n=1 Tax=Saccharomonospora cyanea NA-134 TaxID=882082 RepID=H5XRJ5_9PSEU|nr:transglycosylase domain-containing protein [Saccharomonospora cyanea]EHR63940.1 membrane carboxypeptidase (penicillin-binding protein) [Saccharomonospora cyanea NA-134]
MAHRRAADRPSAPPGGQRPPRRPGERPGGPAAAGAAAGAGAPASGVSEREPELITHRAYNGTTEGPGAYDQFDDDGFDSGERVEDRHYEPGLDDVDGDSGDGGDGGEGGGKKRKGKAALTPAQRRKRRWKIIRRSLYAFVAFFFVLPATAFAITYFLVDVPSPEDVAQQQSKVVTYYYADGKTEMGRDVPPDGGNRILLKPHEIPDHVKRAVYAAEDATFETNPGFDISGILRAVYNQATGGVGGGSTITQQYIKKATENEEYSLTRKWTELVKAFKMSNEQSKEEIITAYLNTIFFGRSAYGIETASQAYFGKSAKEINVSEAALLAGMIQQPGRSEKPEVRQQRWDYVMNQLVANGWLTKAERDAAKLPELIPLEDSRPEAISGPELFIQQKVKQELEAKGYPEEKLQAGGYKVYLTIDQKAQEAAEKAVEQVMEGEDSKLMEALVAVDPKTGGVRAYYGGPYDSEVAGGQYDWASAQRNPGSSFKPFDLVALLKEGKGLGETYDGSSPRMFGDRKVRNSGNESCGTNCTVEEAMKRSINTVFYDIVVNEVGPQAVVDAAMAAGIPENGNGVDSKPTMPTLDGNISIGGGDTMVSPLHMAAAYATFADNGMRHETHFVAKLTTADGEIVFDETSEVATEGEPAFSSDPAESKQIAGNVTKSLIPVLEYSELTCAGGRACAGKTGTHQYVDPGGAVVDENAEAWMVGYSPQISAAVWVGTGRNEPIRDAAGNRVYGSGLPGEIWKLFMDTYHEGKPLLEFPEVEPIGKIPTTPVPEQPEQNTESTTTPPTEESTTTPPTDTPDNTSSSSNTPPESEDEDPGYSNPGGPPEEPGGGWGDWFGDQNNGRGGGEE